jgi:hypothetical protein
VLVDAGKHYLKYYLLFGPFVVNQVDEAAFHSLMKAKQAAHDKPMKLMGGGVRGGAEMFDDAYFAVRGTCVGELFRHLI